MKAITLDLEPAALLTRAADIIDTHGHARRDYITDDGYCSAGAIGQAADLDPADWASYPVEPRLDPAELALWRAARAAALAALRTLVGHLFPDSQPEEMSRDVLIQRVSGWNDDPDRTPEQVVAELRAAAQEVQR